MTKLTSEAQSYSDGKARRNLDAARPTAGELALPLPVFVLRATLALPPGAIVTVAGWLQENAPRFGVTDGSITPCQGFGAWGVERAVTIETATPAVEGFHKLIIDALKHFAQDCAYVTVNGRDAYEVNNAGDVTAITGTE